MTDKSKNITQLQSSLTSSLDPEQFHEQAKRKAQSIKQPDFSSMTLGEIQQQFHELQVKQIEAGLENEQLRNQLEEKEHQAALFRIVNENMLDMVALTDMEGNFIFAGKSHEILGYEPGFLIGKNVMDFVHPDDLLRILEEFAEHVASGQSRTTEYRYRCKDGSYIWLETIGNFIKDENGIPQKIVFSTRDISERKETEKALQESEKRLDLAMMVKNEGIWDWNLVSNETVFDHRYYTMAGYVPDELPQNFTAWRERVHPDDLPKADAEIKAYLSGRSERYDTEFRFRHRNGSWIWIRGQGKIIERDKNGTPLRMIGTHTDITERKRTEEALRKSEERYRTILNEMSEGYQEVDLSGNFTFFNEAFLNIFGYSRDEMMGTNFKHYAAEEVIAKKVYHLYNEMYRTGVPIQNSEWDIIRKDGERRTLEFYASVLKNSEGIPNGFRGIVRDITHRKMTEKQMRLQSLVLDQIKDHVTVTDFDGIITYVNKAEAHALGYSPEEIIGASIEKFGDNPDRGVTQQEILEKTLRHGAWRGEVVNRTIDDQKIILDCRTQVVLDDQGNGIALAGIATDITERIQAENEKERLQARLSQAQKMESVGRLAGGVAHDFNNKLTIINGYAEMAIDMIDPSDPLHETIHEIHTAGKKSADIVRQLLAFARKQAISPVELDLNDTISSMLKMLQRLIGENIDLVWNPGKNLWQVKIDPSQVDQVMANLAVNARDAIADVGKITIETNNIEIDENYSTLYPYFVPGQYVMLAVSDDGSGMDKEMLGNLFEPFFTTKEVGKGTGLGLSTIYGIVRQNNGFINAYSEPGIGTTFKIYLPRHEAEESSLKPAIESIGQAPTGTETILIVEDEAGVLQMSRQILEGLGYTVQTAGNPSEALQLSEEYDGTIHLLITDVVMPEINGRSLASRIAISRPGLKTLYMSGYTANAIVHNGVVDEGLIFLQKPFSLKDLAEKVREAIEQEQEH